MNILSLFRKKLFIIPLILLLAAAIIFSVTYFRGGKAQQTNTESTVTQAAADIHFNQNDITVTPTSFDSTGVNLDTGFKITMLEAVESRKLEAALKVKPSQPYTLKSLSGKEFLLTFNTPLEPDKIYQIGLGGSEAAAECSWAFQTKKEFRVLRTLPGNRSTGAPVNTGIEITFSHEGYDKLDSYFEITPKVKGYFEYHKKTGVFVPEALEYGTIYTVKIKKGLSLGGSDQKLKEDYVFQFQTQKQEQDSQKEVHVLNFYDVMFNFNSNDVPALSLYSDEYYTRNDISVVVYRYMDDETFINDLKKHDNRPAWALSTEEIKYDRSKMEKAMTFKTKVVFTDSPWYQQLLIFPDKLPEGHYLVTVTHEAGEINTLLQVNDLSVYIMEAKNKTLIWANDIQGSKPAEGAVVETEGKKSTGVNNEGMAFFDKLPELGSDYAARYFKIKYGQRSVFIARMASEWNYYGDYWGSSDTAMKYWNYLYLDRGMYLTDDTVRLWGLVKPRSGKDQPGSVTVELVKYNYLAYDTQMTSLVTKEVKLSAYGTYKSELTYKNLNPGSYNIVVKNGEEVLEQRYIQIENYTKPAYKLEVSADKEYMYLGEKANIKVGASFFEGSPVSGLELDYRSYGYDYIGLQRTEGKLKCGQDGKAAVEYVPVLSDMGAAIDWAPVDASFTFENAKAEEEYLQAYQSILVFPRDIMIDAVGNIKDKKLHLGIKTNRIDITKTRDDDWYNYSDYWFKGDAYDTGLNVKIIEKHWEKKEIGQFYDFINKVSRKKYEYYEVTNQVNEFNCSSAAGSYDYDLQLEDFDYNRSYYAEITGSDTKNRPIRITRYLYSCNIYPDYMERMEQMKYYSLKENDNKYKLKSGEQFTLKLIENEKEFMVPENGKALYMVMKNGLLEYTLGKEIYSKSYTDDLVPNAFIKAAYFDGTHVYSAGLYSLNYDYEEKELDISLKPDKENYKPGDTVNLDIMVKDKSGKPCSTEVNISVVDEAFFALMNQEVRTVSGIYSYVFGTGINNEYNSYSPMTQRYGGAECGEGGDEGVVRSDFKDNAFFDSAITGSDGKGKVSFKLPDNLTSWRITGQCVTKDLRAGNSKININCKLPYFISLIFNETYLEGDIPGISVRSYGTELKPGQNVKYEVRVQGPGGYSKAYKKDQAAGEYCNIALDELKEGDYTITVYGSAAGYKDAIEKKFKVVRNILETENIKYFDLSDTLKLAPELDISSENSLVELQFYNKDAARFTRVLYSLYWNWGNRVDQALARKMAAEYLKKYFDNSYVSENEVDLKQYQINDGGIGLLSYDSSNPELTAKIAAVAAERFDTNDLYRYFINIISNKESPNDEIAAAYWGLAALNEPVLLDVNAFLSQKDVTLKQKLYLGNALAQLGDYSGALRVYKEVTAQYCKKITGFMYVDSGSGNDDNVELTALCSLIALKTNQPEREELFSYVTNKSTDDILLNLEKLSYLSAALPEVRLDGSFTLDMGGTREKVTLDGHKRYSRILTYDMLKNTSFSDIKGNIEVSAGYIGPLSQQYTDKSGLVKITRTYSVNDMVTNTFNHSDQVQVNIKVEFSREAPEGYYELTDVLPAGLRYIPPRYWSWEDWHFQGVEGQQVKFGCYYSPAKSSFNFKYLARVVAPGEYSADSAVIKHWKSQFGTFTDRQRVTIE